MALWGSPNGGFAIGLGHSTRPQHQGDGLPHEGPGSSATVSKDVGNDKRDAEGSGLFRDPAPWNAC